MLKNIKAVIFNKTNLFVFFLIIFIVFLILKIFFNIDYSAKYDIRKIYCNQAYQNSSFVLDNDLKTIWGLTEKHQKDENFTVEFSKIKKIKSIEIINPKYAEIKFPEIEIYSSSDGKNSQKIDYKLIKKNNSAQYLFKTLSNCRFLTLKYVDDEGLWPIAEVKINE